MKAGKELDAVVAEHVMGWRREGNMLIPPIGDERLGWAAEWNDSGVPSWLPQYSTAISAAWEVIVKFVPHVRVECYEDSHYTDKVGWHVDIWADTGHGCVEGFPDAPSAICAAALRAIGYKEENND